MKTSLNISNSLYQKAKKKSANEGKTLSEVISLWAELGQKLEEERVKKPKKKFTPISLGKMKVDVSSRAHWMEILDDRD